VRVGAAGSETPIWASIRPCASPPAGAAFAIPPDVAYEISIAELQRSGLGIRASEAIAIVQKLINERPNGPPSPPFAAPSPDNVTVDELGNVTCHGCDVKPAVSEIGILLEAMLPAGTRLPGALRYTMARALLNVDAPPFGTLEELSSALARLERSERDHVVRELVMRARAVANGELHAAIIPFKHAPSTRVGPKTERRRPVPAAIAAELRRELRRADLERYAHRAASTLPDLRGAIAQHKHPISAIVAGLAAGVLLIASGEVMQVPGAVNEWPALPAVASPPRSMPEPAASRLPPADVPDAAAPSDSVAAPTSAVVGPLSRHASYTVHNPRSGTNSRSRKPQAERVAPASRGTPGNGVLGRLRLQWMRNLFTYRRDL